MNVLNQIPSQTIFFVFLALLIVQRLFEMYLSKKNESWILSQGGQEHAPAHFKWMKLLHASWFASIILEVIVLQRIFHPWLGIVALCVVACGQILRYIAISTLGKRWTVRIFTLPTAPAINHGVFKYIKHPNYLGVVLEIIAVPLVHTAWITSVIYTALNAWLLSVRIKAEEKALKKHNQYTQEMSKRQTAKQIL